MDLDPGTTSDYRRLNSSIDWSLNRKRKRNEQRMRRLKKLVGPEYGDEGCREKRPINMIELGVDIFQRGLASHLPQALVTSQYEELSPSAADFEIVLNRRIMRMKLQAALNICAVEALFTMGVMCVGIAVESAFDAGNVFAEPVLFPDLVLDMNAKSWEQQTYVGHDFLVSLDWVRESPLFEGRDRDRFIRSVDARLRNGDEDWQQTRREDYLDLVTLRQLYLPNSNRILICDPQGSSRLPLLYDEWEGPPRGPYHELSFRKVPGNLFPLAPVPMWEDLDEIINRSYTKAARQSIRSKTIGLSRSPDDAKTINDASDGEVVDVLDVGAVEEKTFGGANQSLLGMVQLSKMLLVYLGGNWDALGGLAPQSGTLGQDELLVAGAGGRMKDMQMRTIEFQSQIIEDIAFWTWEDPLADEKFTKTIEGTRFGVPGEWNPESRQGEFFDYNFEVNPYSLINRSPTEQANELIQVLTQVLLPSMPYMTEQSPVDWEFFYKLLARYKHLPELNQIIRWPQGASLPESSPETPRMPSQTTRRYERVNRPGTSRSGTDAALAQLLFGGQPQGSEMASLMQPMK